MATGIPEVDAAESFINSLPEGEFKTMLKKWLTGGFLGDIVKWITGYEYTGGDYALGEIFLNRVLGKETTSRWDTPDGVVPVAWQYFTTLFGIPINVNTDIDTLGGSGSLEAYLNGRPEQRGHVTQQQVTRAHMLLNLPQMHLSDKYGQWPLAAFSLMPYAGPIPDPKTPGALFNGTLANGQEIIDGVPKTNATKGSNILMDGVFGGISWWWYVVIALSIIILLILIFSKSKKQ